MLTHEKVMEDVKDIILRYNALLMVGVEKWDHYHKALEQYEHLKRQAKGA